MIAATRNYLDCVPNISDADFEHFAQESAKRHGYDTAALGFQLGRFQFGSLSHNWEAADMRRLYYRALTIAMERKDVRGEVVAKIDEVRHA
jgi:hypothetical protein